MTQCKYRGNSPGKIAAFTSAYNSLTREQLWSMKHIVIAGDNGDTQHLKRLGVEASDIISCDADGKRLPAARSEGATVPPTCARFDIRKTVAWTLQQEHKIGSIHVDLMRSVIGGAPILSEILDLVNDIKTNPLILFTFTCYHDPGLGKIKGEKNPGQARVDHLTRIAGLEGIDIRYLPYRSDTKASQGSPMCLAHFNLW